MAIDFERDNSTCINFGDISTIDNLSTITIMAWINAESLADGETYTITQKRGQTNPWGGWNFAITNGASAGRPKYVEMDVTWSGAVGIWRSQYNVIDTGAWYHVAATYDGGAVGNDPLFYVNGVNSATIEGNVPAGAIVSNAAASLYIADWPLTIVGTTHTYFDGVIADVRVYNRILSAAEVLDIYSLRAYNTNYNGLVFEPMLYGAAGLQAFDGAALAAANKIVDPISGALGTPSGSPIGVGESFLSICP